MPGEVERRATPWTDMSKVWDRRTAKTYVPLDLKMSDMLLSCRDVEKRNHEGTKALTYKKTGKTLILVSLCLRG